MFDGDADGAGSDFDSSAKYRAGQPQPHAADNERSMHSDAQLGVYDESISGTYGHVHDPACEPSAVYYEAGGYGYYGHDVADGLYLAGDLILDGSCATSWHSGDMPEYGGDDGDYGGDY